MLRITGATELQNAFCAASCGWVFRTRYTFEQYNFQYKIVDYAWLTVEDRPTLLML